MTELWEKYSFIILFIILTTILGLYFIFNLSKDESSSMTVIVKSGDTLWTISEQFAEEQGMATNDFVKLVKKENNINNKIIKSGDRLVIPVKVNRDSDHLNQFAFENE